MFIKNYTQKEMAAVCQFANNLHEAALLEQYKYLKSPNYIIKAKTTSYPLAQNFFSGKWLERFVFLSAKKAVDSVAASLEKELDFSYLLNPQISLPNGDDFELDLLFCVNDSYYWIEAKSGDYRQHVSKYSKMAKLLKLDSRHAMMVLSDISESAAADLSSLFSMTVLSLSQLEDYLVEVITSDQAA